MIGVKERDNRPDACGGNVDAELRKDEVLDSSRDGGVDEEFLCADGGTAD